MLARRFLCKAGTFWSAGYVFFIVASEGKSEASKSNGVQDNYGDMKRKEKGLDLATAWEKRDAELLYPRMLRRVWVYYISPSFGLHWIGLDQIPEKRHWDSI